jgi:hypothetical protein
MALNMPTLVYLPCYQIFARPVTFVPLMSQPGAGTYPGRGIFDTNELQVIGVDGSLIADTRTELDILQSEFDVLPEKEDQVFIPDDEMLPGGVFEISDVSDKGNAGGEVSLTLKRLVEPRLIGTQYFLGSPSFSRPPLTVIAA